MTMQYLHDIPNTHDEIVRKYALVGLEKELKEMLKGVKISIRLEYVRIEIMAEKIERTCDITGVLEDSIGSFTKEVEEYIMSSILEKGTEVSSKTGRDSKEVLHDLLTIENAQEYIERFVPDYKDGLVREIAMIKISYESGKDDYDGITDEEVMTKRNEIIRKAGLFYSDFQN